jgi:hypothetical protein
MTSRTGLVLIISVVFVLGSDKLECLSLKKENNSGTFFVAKLKVYLQLLHSIFL